jgi:FkbM family methyltransferase
MDIDTSSEVDMRIYFNIMDVEVKRTISKYVHQGETALDIGANIGYFTLLMAHRVGSRGRVHSFEPNSPVCQRMAQHVLKNGFEDRVIVHDCAVSNVSGSIQLSIYDDPGLSSILPRPDIEGTVVEARVVTLDGLFSSGEIGVPDFIKIDVEGAELFVLEGGEELIRQVRPIIVTEISPEQKKLFDYTATDIRQWAHEHSYSFGFLHPYRGYQKVSWEPSDSLPEGNALLLPT